MNSDETRRDENKKVERFVHNIRKKVYTNVLELQ